MGGKVGLQSDDWSGKVIEVHGGKKLHCEGPGGSVIEVEAIKGNAVVTERNPIHKGIAVVNHVNITGGKATENGIYIDVGGKQLFITRIEINVKGGKRIGVEEVPYEVKRKDLGGLEKLSVTLEKTHSEDGTKVEKISVKNIRVLFAGQSKTFVEVNEAGVLDIAKVEANVERCREKHPEFDKELHMSGFEDRRMDGKQTQG